MRRLLIGATVIAGLLVIIAVVLTVPPKTPTPQKITLIFLGILTGLAAIAEIVGLVNYFESSESKNAPGDVIVTQGKMSPGKVGGNYVVQAEKSSRRHATADDSSSAEFTRKAKNTGADHILTHGDYSPGKVEGDYDVSEEKKD